MERGDIEYLNQKLSFDSTGNIYDSKGGAVMMGWEDPIMEESAKIICSKGGDILNVGFGMGLIDTHIETYPINSHWIIEAHPDIQKQILIKNWLLKPHIKPLFGRWQDIGPYLPKFDGIYIDTYDEPLDYFYKNVHNILKPGGVFSFFYNDNEFHKPNSDHHLSILSKNFNISFKTIILDIPKTQSPNNNQYWDPNRSDVKIPICTLKN